MPKKKAKAKAVKKKKTKKVKLTPEAKKALKQKQKERKKATAQLIQRATPLLAIGSVLGLILGVAIEPKLGVMAPAGILAIALSYLYPRKALWFFLIYLPFSGTITYALGGSAFLQLAKDAFFFPAWIGLVQLLKKQRGKAKKESVFIPEKFKPILPWLLIIVAYCALVLILINGGQQLEKMSTAGLGDLARYRNDKSPFLVGVLGYKVFLGYVPLIFCTYHLIRSSKELLFTTRLHTVLAIVCSALAFVQYQMLSSGRCEGTDHLLGDALFRATLEARCFVGGSLVWSPSQNMIRLPGTFVAPWQWAWFLIANASLTFTTAFNDPSPKWRIVGLVGMAGIFLNSVISGQRIALVLVPIIVIILMLLTGQITNLKRLIPIGGGLAVAIVVSWILFPDVIQERIDSFVSRWNAAPADDFIAHQIDFTWRSVRRSLLLMGSGIGRATNSARLFGDTTLVETWFPKVLFEVGVWGLLLWLCFVTAITVTTFRAYRSVKDKNLRGIGASYWVFILFISYQTYYYPLDVDPVAVYYWYMIGVVLKLPVVAEQDRQRLEAERAAEEAAYQEALRKRRERLGVEAPVT
jgi:hypothetical protein